LAKKNLKLRLPVPDLFIPVESIPRCIVAYHGETGLTQLIMACVKAYEDEDEQQAMLKKVNAFVEES
jgi:hypothetical protein